MREGQAVAVPDRDVHHSGGGQLLYQFRTECCGLRGAAAEAGPAAPGIHLETSTLSRYLKKKVYVQYGPFNTHKKNVTPVLEKNSHLNTKK